MGDTYNPYSDLTHFDNVVVTGNPYILRDDIFSPEEMQRIQKELNLWKFYRGNQWKVQRPTGEPQITLNYCRAFVDKGVAFLMGKGFSFKVKPEAEEITKPLLNTIWEDNNKELLGVEMAQAGGITGNAWVKVVVENYDPKLQPEYYDMYPNGRIRILNLPTYTVFPTWDAHDRDRMVRCTIIYPVILEQENADGSISKEKVWYREEITSQEITEYINDTQINKRENILREIPVVRIKNLPLPGEPYGISDLQDIIPLQVEINNKTTDISDIINYHAAPVTIVQGAKTRDLERGARKVWSGIPKDGKVYNLELETDLAAANNYLGFLKTAMFEIAHMPKDAFGHGEGRISNTSGIALHIKNQPLMELTRTKWITYGEGIRKINRLILKYAELIKHPDFDLEGFEKLKSHQKYWTEIIFPNPLPKDELMQLQLMAQKISLLLQSRKDALTELGETEAAEKLAEIIEEAQYIQDSVYDADLQLERARDLNLGGIMSKDEKARDDISDD